MLKEGCCKGLDQWFSIPVPWQMFLPIIVTLLRNITPVYISIRVWKFRLQYKRKYPTLAKKALSDSLEFSNP